MLTDKKILKDISSFDCNPYYELSYLPGSEYVSLSIKEYEGFIDYSVRYKAESAREAQEVYDEGVKWLTRVSKEIKMDDIGI